MILDLPLPFGIKSKITTDDLVSDLTGFAVVAIEGTSPRSRARNPYLRNPRCMARRLDQALTGCDAAAAATTPERLPLRTPRPAWQSLRPR
jgi:hypothetical protein